MPDGRKMGAGLVTALFPKVVSVKLTDARNRPQIPPRRLARRKSSTPGRSRRPARAKLAAAIPFAAFRLA